MSAPDFGEVVKAWEQVSQPDAVSRNEPPEERATWDELGLSVAAAMATRADCSRRQVGAAMFTADHRVVATGYNGAPSGAPGCLTTGACPRATSGVAPLVTSYESGAGECIALHAEDNILLRATWADMVGSTLYITCEPCAGCRKRISGTPLARVVWPSTEDDRGEWIL